VISRQRTSIQALDWHPGKWLRTGVAAGIGSNQPYLAATTDIESSRLSLKAAYLYLCRKSVPARHRNVDLCIGSGSRKHFGCH